MRLRANYFGFAFLVRSHGTVYDPTKDIKMHITMHFWFYGTIYIFKNYFIIVILGKIFQFLAK